MFELWSRHSGNRLGAFRSEEEALALVRELVDDYGPKWAENLVLGIKENGRPRRVADGPELLERAGITSMPALPFGPSQPELPRARSQRRE